MDIDRYIVNGSISVIVKPNAPRSEVIGWDENRKKLKVAIAAAPDKDKANRELVKFFSKLLGKNIEIIRGTRSREKVLRIA